MQGWVQKGGVNKEPEPGGKKAGGESSCAGLSRSPKKEGTEEVSLALL